MGQNSRKTRKESLTRKKKWVRRQHTREGSQDHINKVEVQCEKRNLIDVMIIDGTVEGCGVVEKRLKGADVQAEDTTSKP